MATGQYTLHVCNYWFTSPFRFKYPREKKKKVTEKRATGCSASHLVCTDFARQEDKKKLNFAAIQTPHKFMACLVAALKQRTSQLAGKYIKCFNNFMGFLLSSLSAPCMEIILH